MIVIENLIKSYGNRIVLNGVNLKIEEGKIYALLGKNGAGKSTLINILSGILKYDGGEIEIDSELLGRYAYHFKRKLGCVFENPLLIEKFSPIEYLQFLAIMYDLNKKDVSNRIHYLIDIFQLEEYKDTYLSNCSKGIRKRVSVAAALLHQPKYLLLDELFEGLDFLSVQNVLRILKEYAANGGAVLIASHQFDSLIDIADSFLLLKDGNFVFESTIKELASKATKDIKKQFENLLL